MTTEVNFSDLAEKSGQLVNRFQSTFQGFNINRSLKEIGEYSKQLNDITSSKSTLYNDSYQKAINKYNIEPNVIGESLSNITPSSFIEVEQVPTDIDQFLKGEFESMIMNTIHEVQKKTTREFNENYQRASLVEWSKDKKQLEETLGQRFIKVHKQYPLEQQQQSLMLSNRSTASPMLQLTSSQQQYHQYGSGTSSMFMSNAGGFNNNNNNSSVNGQLMMSTRGNVEDRTRLSNKMRAYAEVVYEYLLSERSVESGSSYPLVENLMNAQLAEVTKYRQVIEDVWILIDKQSSLSSSSSSSKSGSSSSSLSDDKTMQLVKRSIQFLEEQFVNTIKISNVQKPPIDTPEDNFRNCSVWSIIYYSLRSGYYQVIIDISQQLPIRYRELIRNITIHRKDDLKCPQEILNKMTQEYRIIRNESKDYFKIAVFNILSAADATNVHSNKILFPFIQDLIWWRLSFIRLQTYSLQTLQVAINETTSQIQFDPFVLFQIHLLTCQFELGIAHLSLTNQEDALHYALALNQSGLIRKPRPEQTVIDSVDIYNPASGALNLVAMIRQYIKTFSTETDNVEALHYYLLIEDEQIQTLCISDLIVTSTGDTEFARYLLKVPEFIKRDQWRRIIEQTALTFEFKGNFQSSIAYWLLIEEYARVLELYNNRMSSLITTNSTEKEQLYLFGMELFNDKQLQIKISKSEKQAYLAFEQLLQLCQFFDLYNNQKYQDALDLQDKIGLTPRTERDVEPCVENYRFLSPHVTRNFSSIIQVTIDIIMRLYELVALPGGSSSAFMAPATSQLYAGRQQTLLNLQERSQALTLFAGKIDFPMSGNTLTKLMNFMINVKK
ncbi:nucleoporin 93 [Heterostelium album PN500]|uniref:Nuclear pore protein n=1 Tax=Heterostelium pallidum (strain ATCC 26659 / Pp 5 / PN500) TaxID=670386 RepID=D3B3U6_HETP5|nr:nucleoporin 93 [Heterostelium album PN500]EFA83994.1 nucleoporin 93 [Heterostelium album PN500]|eukprot:XP_020436111.1 nucleoporin 93 [Heterostelium album PN500]